MKKKAVPKKPKPPVPYRQYEIAYQAAAAALELLEAMEEQNALRLPFPGHSRTIVLLRATVRR